MRSGVNVALIYSVRPEPFDLTQDKLVERQSPSVQGLRQAQPERFRINQRFLSVVLRAIRRIKRRFATNANASVLLRAS